MTDVVIFRACDRPGYLAHTWPRLVEATDPDRWIVVVENSRDHSSRNLDVLRRHPRDRTIVHVAGRRLGVTEPIRTGLGVLDRPVEHVLVADDDVLLPDGWDVGLVEMIGRWDVVGVPRAERVISKRRVDGAYPAEFMAAGGCAFPARLLDDHPLKGNARRSFNTWSRRFRCAWHGTLVKQEVDKYDDAGLKLSPA